MVNKKQATNLDVRLDAKLYDTVHLQLGNVLAALEWRNVYTTYDMSQSTKSGSAEIGASGAYPRTSVRVVYAGLMTGVQTCMAVALRFAHA
jgi:uncharacterized membrane protein